MANTFGTQFRLTTFGESHGPAIGAVIDGCPAGIAFDMELLRRDLSRRRPGQEFTSARNESDEPEVLSGIFEGRTTGAPIAILVRNNDQRSTDYEALRDLFRPSHADYTYAAKYGVRDHRGGGRSSARETLARVAGGAIARMYLKSVGDISLRVAVTRLGPIDALRSVSEMDAASIYTSPVRCDDPASEGAMIDYLERLRSEGDSTGGLISVAVEGVPPGVGEPIYDKLSARLAGAMISINGATGFDIGVGFESSRRRGSENNDQFSSGGAVGESIRTTTNNSGGIQGGISNGMPILFRVAFKPPSSIARPQQHATAEGETREHTVEGRHDPSIVIRAVPVVEAMTMLVLADLAIINY